MASSDPIRSDIWQARLRSLKRLAILAAVAAIGLVIGFLVLWNSFFVYVPPAQHLVIIAKSGAPLPPGEVVAEPGQQGVRREVLGEGWHFIMPYFYISELEKNTIVPPSKVGILIARGGKPLPPDKVLAEPEIDASGAERVVYTGIQRQVLMPGSYRINLHGYEVQLKDMVSIEPGYVGVRRRLRGNDGTGDRFTKHDNEKGYLEAILQPGLYALNPYEYEVMKMEVGIYQTTFHHSPDPSQDTALKFTARNGFPISMDCTIEWEILPEDQPWLVQSYKDRRAVEERVIQLQAAAVGLAKGSEFGVQDLLEGTQRERFQNEFRDGLIAACNPKVPGDPKPHNRVSIHSAFIRNIVIPEDYLKPIRDKQIAAETVLTNQAKEETAKSTRDLELEKSLVFQEVAKVKAETERLVAGVVRQTENVKSRTTAELDKLEAEYQAGIAILDAQQEQAIGEARAQATQQKETARASLYKSKLEVFQNDGNAFLRYTLAEKLNPNVSLRLVHSGPGTLWTNMDGKGLQFQIPMPNGPSGKPISPAPAAK